MSIMSIQCPECEQLFHAFTPYLTQDPRQRLLQHLHEAHGTERATSITKGKQVVISYNLPDWPYFRERVAVESVEL